VTGDHGFIDSAPDQLIELERHPALAETLVLPLCGDRRVAYCYVDPAKRGQFERYVRAELSDFAILMESDALIAQGYFGLGPPHRRCPIHTRDGGAEAFLPQARVGGPAPLGSRELGEGVIDAGRIAVGFRASRVAVRVMARDQPAIRGLDLRVGGRLGNLQDLVRVAAGHKRSAAKVRRDRRPSTVVRAKATQAPP